MLYRYTNGEIIAGSWMQYIEGWFSTNMEKRNYHDAGNKVIALAEQIKAERSIVAMEYQ
jgi:hypothetical protein